MGNIFMVPLTSKEVIQHDVDNFRSGICSMQGYRGEMEDALLAVTAIPNKDAYVAGVFDGHCGGLVSKDLSRKLLPVLQSCEKLDEATIRAALLKYDFDLCEAQKAEGGALDSKHGSTAVFAIFKPLPTGGFNVMGCNVGDSRILLIKPDGSFIPLSDDHKPDNEEETNRIVKSGGHVQNARVNGQLALSRAFGDVVYKIANLPQTEQAVIAQADFISAKAMPGDRILIACDGIFEACENQQVVEFLHANRTDDLTVLMRKLLDFCIVTGSKDNMSAQIVEIAAEKLETPVTIETFSPGILYPDNDAASSTNRSYRREIAHLGFNPDNVIPLAVKSESSRPTPSELQALLTEQQSAPTFPLTRENDASEPIFLPRDITPFPLPETEEEDDFGGNDLARMIAMLRTANDPYAFRNIVSSYISDADGMDMDEEDLDAFGEWPSEGEEHPPTRATVTEISDDEEAVKKDKVSDE